MDEMFSAIFKGFRLPKKTLISDTNTDPNNRTGEKLICIFICESLLLMELRANGTRKLETSMASINPAEIPMMQNHRI